MRQMILIADDEAPVLAATSRVLERAGYRVVQAGDATAAFDLLQRQPVDLGLFDLHLPGKDGLALLDTVREAGFDLPVIMFSGSGTIEAALQAVRRGAHDFLEKPVDPDHLVLCVRNALKLEALARSHAELERELHPATELLGKSSAMNQLRTLIAKAAPTEGRVLIMGENGTGKELVARAIHRASHRAAGPYVKVNCAAIPQELIESELFGHEKGAFTGAIGARRGKIESADGGTLFLDEVGDMSAAMQVKVLRVLQEGELERVGGNTTVRVDVRVVAATNRDVEQMVRETTFREDLYYRLNVIRITTPPLRERREDVAELAQVFLGLAAAKNHRSAMQLSPEAVAALAAYDYPGNVRELQNLVERLVILVDHERVEESDVRSVLPPPAADPAAEGSGSASLYRPGVPFHALVAEAEAQILRAAIERYESRMTETAEALGLERSHLYKKCKALGIDIHGQTGLKKR